MANKTKANQRSLKHLRDLGWMACIVERWIPPRGKMKFGVRIDAFSMGDILACRPIPDEEIALVQCFPMARWKDHVEKISALPELKNWKNSGGILFLHGWALKPKDGIRGAKKVWTLREEQL
jgi:hypothetical protein